MTTIYLHIGMPKTGTTSLQKFLFYNREKLLETGYLYPITGTKITSDREPKGYSHNTLVRRLTQKTDSKGNGGSQWESWDELKREINRSPLKPQNVIISAEFFTGPGIYNADLITTTKRMLEDYDTKIVIYLRRQDDFLRSYYCHLITFFIRKDIKEFIRDWQYMADYYKTLELWKNIFGLDNIIVRVFEKEQMKNGNLFNDFLAAINFNNKAIDFGFSKDIKENISVNSVKAIKLINGIDKISEKIPFQFQKDEYRASLVRRLIFNHKTLKLISYLPTNFLFNEELLSKQDRMSILNEFEASNRKVAQEYLGREDGKLFYSTP